jgi:predicted transcriptional regulator
MNDMKERERHGLPHHTVRAIRKLGEVGLSHKSIGDRFGIARSTVSEIIERKNYQHVGDKDD